MNERKIFLAYEKVRKSGKYNMYDPRARQLTGLDPEEYVFAMRNYSALAQKYKKPNVKEDTK